MIGTQNSLSNKKALYEKHRKGRMIAVPPLLYTGAYTPLYTSYQFCNGNHSEISYLGSEIQFKSYLPHLYLQIIFQPMNDPLWQANLCVLLFLITFSYFTLK